MANKKLDYYQERFFDGVIILIYILIVISFFGLFTKASIYLNDVNFYLRVYVCLFLIWRFNPLRSSYEITTLDIKIAFNSGVFLLTTTALNQYLQKFSDDAKKDLFGVGTDVDKEYNIIRSETEQII